MLPPKHPVIFVRDDPSSVIHADITVSAEIVYRFIEGTVQRLAILGGDWRR